MAKQKRVKRACMACGREVAVLSLSQNGGGGKGRVKHKCPHGVDCITGAAPHHGTGYNAAPTSGKNACVPCSRRMARLKRIPEHLRGQYAGLEAEEIPNW
jgi:ribosomal protein S14